MAALAWPRVGRVLGYRGLVLARAGDLAAAAELYRAGMQLDPLDVVLRALRDLLAQNAPDLLTAPPAPTTPP